MSLVQVALRRPYTILVVILGVILGAIFGLQKMAQDVFPSLGVPTIYVAQPYGGMDPAQMEGFLTYYYEYHFLYITGLQHVESKSIQSAAIIKLQFYPGTDMANAMSETVSYVNRARAFMPPGTVPPFVMRFDAGSVPVGALVFASETKSVGQIQDLALNTIRPMFATLPGVSAPPPFGGSARTIVVNADPERMRSYNLSPDEIVVAIGKSNLISPSGNLNIGGEYPIVPVNAIVQDIKVLEGVPIRTGGGTPVYLRDVAQVRDASDLVTSVALADGRPTVYIPVTKRADASTLSVVNLVKANMAKFQAALPDDVTISYEFDQSPFVTRAIAGLTTEGGLGAVLTGIMVLLFLRDWRSAVIVVINIPIALLAAILALWLTGASINLMTLGGLALAVGILVDMSTVTVENLHTHMARGSGVGHAAVDSVREVALPLLIAMLCVLAVFLPSFFMEGVARALFVPLALSVGFAMVASYFLACTLVPILSVWLLKAHERDVAGAKASFFDRFKRRYETGVRASLSQRWLMVAGYSFVVVLIIAILGPRLQTEIFPKVEAGQLQIRFRAPAGTELGRTVADAQKILAIVKNVAGPTNVTHSLGLIGVHAPNYPINLIHLWNSGPHEGVLQFELNDDVGLNLAELRETLRRRFAKDLPDVQVSFEPSDIVSRVMSFGAPTPIEVDISGPSLANSRLFAEKIRQKLAGLSYLRDVQFGQTLDYPSIAVGFDRERGGALGITTTDVVRALAPLTSSSRFTQPIYWAAPNTGIALQIQVEMPTSAVATLDDLNNLPVANGTGGTSLLRNVATVQQTTMVGEYDRYDSQRFVSITTNIEGADLGTAARGVRAAIAELGKPPDKVSVALRGQVEPLETLLYNLGTGLAVAVVVILLVLIANFQSPALGLITLSTTPAVIAGVILTLWVTGTSLNLQSFMGAIMAVGVAVANAILLVAFAERSRLSGLNAQAAAQDGAVTRLRPILMSSLAMMAGMLPIALGLGASGEQAAPLGRAVLGGLLGAMIATLLVLPSIFALARKTSTRRIPSLDPDDPAALKG